MNRIILKHKKQIIARWIARVIAAISTAFFLFMIIGDLIFISEPFTFEGVMVGGFAFVFLLCILFALWNEGIGGLILIISSIAFAVFIFITAGNYKFLASVLISSPFLLSGVLFRIVGKNE